MGLTFNHGWSLNRPVPVGVAIAESLFSDARNEFKFGYNADIGTVEETVWDEGGRYSYLSAASALKVSSASTDDDAGGTGALTIELFGLDADYVEIDETVTLDGQTPVNTVNSYLRIFRMVVRSAGGGGSNAGILYAGTGDVTTGVPANVFACIQVGENQTLMGLWTVPAGKTAHLVGISVATGGGVKFMTNRLVARPPGEVFQSKLKSIASQNGGAYALNLSPVPLSFLEKTDIEIRSKSDAGTQDLSVAMCFILIDD